MTVNAQEIILNHAIELIRPLSEASKSADSLERLLGSIGWSVAVAGLSLRDVQDALESCQKVVEQIEMLVEEGIEDITALSDALKTVMSGFNAIRAIRERWQNPGGLPASVPETFIEDLLFWLLDVYMSTRMGRAQAILELAGLITRLPCEGIQHADGTFIRNPMVRMRIDFAQVGRFLKDPTGVIYDRFVQGNAGRPAANMVLDMMAPYLVRLLDEYGLDAFYGIPGISADSGLSETERALAQRFLCVSYVFRHEDTPDLSSRLDAIVSLVDIDNAFVLIINPVGTLAVDTNFGLLAFKLSAQGTIQPLIYTRGKAFFKDGLNSKLALTLNAGLHPPPEDAPLVRLGGEKGTRFIVSQMEIQANVILNSNEVDIDIRYVPGGVSLTIARSDGDGFLNKVLPEQPIVVPFALGVGWSTSKGLYFSGGAALEVNLPIHVTLLDILTIDIVHLRLAARPPQNDQPADVQLSAAVTGRLKLGPIKASAERLGLASRIAFPDDKKGNLGVADLSLGFKAPTGIGLAIDASVVTGGGYLSIDQEKGEYTGILELSIKNKLALKAIGILTVTKPGQPPNFSLFILITAEFPAIQLGYGFTLNGVGGLLGVNRTIVLEALQTGLKSGAIDSILFPENPVANAPMILNNIRSFFPQSEGRFIIGLMVKIGWGRVPLITIKAGVIIELPPPLRIILLGQLAVTLPDPKDTVVDLRLDILGWIYPEKNELGIDATLHDSRLLDFPISGDMIMRLRWGDKPVFVQSLGGFHPKFAPPPGLPVMERLAISLAEGDNPRIRLEAYLALTSNTLQFGARLDIFVEKDLGFIGRFSASAYLAFDVLIRFSPFYFLASIEGNVSLRRNGDPVLELTLYLALEGPNPWHAWGKASFDLGGIVKGELAFDVTTGSKLPDATRPTIDLVKLLKDALADSSNWSAQLPEAGNAPIKFRDLENMNKMIVLHPMGRITVRQRVLPLGHLIAKFGEAEPINTGPFTISTILSDNVNLLRQNPEVRDYFAAAQFFELSDDEKLSRPSFELYRCGAVAEPGSGNRAPDFGSFYTSSEIGYKQSFSDKQTCTSLDTPYSLPTGTLDRLAVLGAAGQAALRRNGLEGFRGPDQLVTVGDGQFAVVNPASLESVDGKIYSTYIEARTALQPVGKAGSRVTGAHELN